MIITAFIYVAYFLVYVLTLPLRAFDDVVLSSDFTNSLSTVVDYYSTLQPIFPVEHLLTAFGILITFEVAINTYKVIKWIYNKIPGIN